MDLKSGIKKLPERQFGSRYPLEDLNQISRPATLSTVLTLSSALEWTLDLPNRSFGGRSGGCRRSPIRNIPGCISFGSNWDKLGVISLLTAEKSLWGLHALK